MNFLSSMFTCKIKRTCLLVIANLLFVFAVHAQKKYTDTITLTKVLSSLYDVAQLPLYMDKTFSAQVSSYDTTGGNDDGFSGKYSFIRRNPDSSLVIFDVKGAGVINRIWTPTPTGDTLDFYLDGNTKPALSVMYGDLFSGKVPPFILPLCGNDLGGFYCYFPILFSNGCVIISRGKQMQFHQLGYRLYPKGTLVKPFSTNLSVAENNALQTIAGLWNKTNRTIADIRINKSNLPVEAIVKEFELLPGKSATIFSATAGGRIEGIEISPAAAFENLSKLVDIEIAWDDDATAAVYCPLADFFGYAFGKPAMQSLLLGTHDNTNYCYIPMPFDKKATIRLRYRNPGAEAAKTAGALQLKSRIYYSGAARMPGKEGRFYASWNNITKDGQPHVIADIKGRGHFIGTVLQAQG